MVHLPKPHCHKTRVELYHGDCLIGLRELPQKSVDICVTSPPYNLGIKYSAYKDDEAREEYLKWSFEWGKRVKNVLKDDGALFLNVGASPSNPMLPHEIATTFSDGLFTLQNTIHWIKSITLDDEEDAEPISRGHFKPISSGRFLNDCHEYIFHFTKVGKTPIDRLALGVPYADKSNIARWAHTREQSRDRRCRGNTWFIPYKTIRSRDKERPHPATFPAKLAEYCILLHGKNPGGVVLDPFVGIGNAAIAACATQAKRFIGFDIDSRYLDVAADTLKTHVRSVRELGTMAA